MRLLVLLPLVACSGASQGPGEASTKVVDPPEGLAMSPREAPLPDPSLQLGDPVLHEDELPEGCKNGQAGDGLLVVVNKGPGQNLRCDWRPRDLTRLSRRYLVPARSRNDRSAKLRKPAAEALTEMIESAQADGIRFYVRSAYRSYREQENLYHYKVSEHGEEHAQRFSAQAGRSQHQLGTTVDLTTESLRWQIEDDFADTRAGDWLSENAFRFGYALSYPEGHEELTGYAFEPWHYRFIGKRAAEEQRQSGHILEEYLLACQDDPSGLACPEE